MIIIGYWLAFDLMMGGAAILIGVTDRLIDLAGAS